MGLPCPFCGLPLWVAPGCPGLWLFCLGCQSLFLPEVRCQGGRRLVVAGCVFSPQEVSL